MSGYLLDTNVVSEMRKGDRANATVVRWFEEHAEEEFWLSVLVVGELRRGVELVGRRDPVTADVLRTWLDSTVDSYVDRILPITLDIAQRLAHLGVPDPIPFTDGLLAATALAHGLTLVTRNTADVVKTGVSLANPFDSV